MKTWKKIFIVALCVLSVAAVAFVGLLTSAYYEKYHEVSYWEDYSQYVSQHILMVHGYHGIQGFEQLKDMRTGKFTTPELNHIFINEYDKEDSLVVFRTNDRLRGYVNVNTGKIIISAQYKRAWNFSEGIAAVFKEGAVSFIKADGSPAFDKQFPIYYELNFDNIAFQFHNGLCVMRTMEGKWGLINTQGEWVVEPVYSTIYAPQYGYRIVMKEETYGLLTMEGKEALPAEYDLIRLSEHYHGFFIAKDGYAKVVDKDLNTVVPFAYDRLCRLGYVNEYRSLDEYDSNGNTIPYTPEFWRYDIGANSGIVDRHGNVILPAQYYMVRMVDENTFEAEVTSGGERFLFDSKGRYIGKSNF